jgi:hypothetical protein
MNRLLYRLENGSGHRGDAIEKSHLARSGHRVGFLGPYTWTSRPVRCAKLQTVHFARNCLFQIGLSVTEISLAFPDSPHPILQHLLGAVECRHLIQRDSLPAEWHTWWADSRINICCSFRYFTSVHQLLGLCCVRWHNES